HQAMPMLEHGLQLCQEGPLAIWSSTLAAALGAAYTLAGRVSEALPLSERAVAWDTSMELMSDHALCMAWLSEAYLLADRREQACTELSTAIEMYQAMEMTLWLPQTELALAQVDTR